jgi:hypothetical protein
MSPVVSLIGRVVVIPLAIVDWDLHFCRVAIIETIAALEILVTVEILRIVNEWVVVESLIVAIASSPSPCLAVSLRLLGLCFV